MSRAKGLLLDHASLLQAKGRGCLLPSAPGDIKQRLLWAATALSDFRRPDRSPSLTLFHQGGVRDKGRGDERIEIRPPTGSERGSHFRATGDVVPRGGRCDRAQSHSSDKPKEMRHYSYEEALTALSTYPGGKTSSWKPTGCR